MSLADADLVALVDDFFTAESGQDVVAAAERDGFPAALWTSAAQIGLTRLAVPEERGGTGGTLPDAVALLVGAGRHAVPLPLLESWLACSLLAAAGRDVPEQAVTVTLGRDADDLAVEAGVATGTVHRVPWGRDASTLVVVLPGPAEAPARIVALDPTTAAVTRRADLAGMPSDTLTFDGAAAEELALPWSRDLVVARAALGRAAQLAGAIDAAATLTLGYTQERRQFGAPIGSFQAVQQHVVTLAQAAAVSVHAVERAAAAAQDREALFECLAAKLIASEQASIAARAAHQSHGAIGMTKEYRLQQFTRRLMAWRSDLGAERDLGARLGDTAGRADSLAHLVTAAEPRLRAG